ncbi:Ig-like domain-containing protein [Pseudoalteromonas aurantia]|nr:Ig-like domain-containing protein [Pseudoalteromonas aurantia]
MMSAQSYASNGFIPLVIDYIQHDIKQESTGSIAVKADSTNGEIYLSWQSKNTFTNWIVEEYQRDNTKNSWTPVYQGNKTDIKLVKTQSADYQYRVKGCNNDKCQLVTNSAYITIDLPIKAPKNLTAIEQHNTHVVNWNSVTEATLYHVELSIGKGEWQTYQSTEQTYLTLKTIINDPITYRVKACDTLKNKCSPWSTLSETVSSNLVHDSVTTVVATSSDTTGENIIKWQAVEHANDYRIELSFNNANWVYVTSLLNTYFKHSPQVHGAYQYRITACFQQFSQSVCSPVSPVSNVIFNNSNNSTPTNVTAQRIGDQHRISWNAVYDTAIYEVSISSDGISWSTFRSQQQTTFSHRVSQPGRFSYRVRSCFVINQETVCGHWSEPTPELTTGDLIDVPKNLIVSNSNNKISIAWSGISVANYYQLSVALNQQEWLTLLQTTSQLNFDMAPHISGDYRYRVRGCIEPDICSPWSLPTPTSEVNLPIIISGKAPERARYDTLYSFTPTINTIEKGEITFSIQNKPKWAVFNVETGELRGTPIESEQGVYNNITISVSHAKAIKSLPAFAITVEPNKQPRIIGNTPKHKDILSTATPVIVNVDAVDDDGTIVLVELQVNNGAPKVSYSAPYSFDLGLLAAGQYDITVRAKDNEGEYSKVEAISVTIENKPPRIIGNTPKHKDILSTATPVIVNVDAVDDDGTIVLVELQVNNGAPKVSLSAPYSFDLGLLAAGQYDITLRAKDNEGEYSKVEAISVSIEDDNSKSKNIIFIHTDLLGSPVVETDKNGETI